ncbi:MAG: plasmid mobilization relaxosome protein MobC [Myxococcota bacterium]
MASGSEKRRRMRTIAIRCTDSEYAVIHAKASSAGLFAAGYLRAVALGAPGPRALRRPPVDRRELARLLGELGRVGNNLNQIARALNTGDPPPNGELSTALAEFAEMRALIRTALGHTTGPAHGD